MDGYGCKAIHQALIDAGLLVSKSTVQREVARLTRPTPPAAEHRASPLAVPRPAPNAVGATPSPATLHQPADGQQSGKDLAAAFMKGRITNPLFRNRS